MPRSGGATSHRNSPTRRRGRPAPQRSAARARPRQPATDYWALRVDQLVAADGTAVPEYDWPIVDGAVVAVVTEWRDMHRQEQDKTPTLRPTATLIRFRW
jgi:hypothetical protein